jgi:hypothetical protein
MRHGLPSSISRSAIKARAAACEQMRAGLRRLTGKRRRFAVVIADHVCPVGDAEVFSNEVVRRVPGQAQDALLLVFNVFVKLDYLSSSGPCAQLVCAPSLFSSPTISRTMSAGRHE